MRPQMIILSSTFPYGKGEKTFIGPELDVLTEEYDIILITHADANDIADIENRSIINPHISIIHSDNNISFGQKIYWGLRFFSDQEGRRELKDILRKGSSFFECLYQSMGFYILAMKELKNIKKAGLLQKEKMIICYSYWYTYYCYAFLKLKKKYPDLKVITRTHGVDLYNERMKGMRQPFKQTMDRQLDGVIFAADFAKEYYLGQFAADAGDKKYVVCKLGVSAAGEKEVCDGKFCLLSCSYAIPLKRIELIIQALSLLEKEDIYWIHIGDGESLENLKAYAKEKLGNKKNIDYIFKGYLDNSQIRKVYESENVKGFITTSSTEGGCPVSIQEAMSYGIPVIGTDVGGISEMIKENGFLLPADPTQEMVAGVIKKLYYLKQSEFEHLSQKSYKIWKQEYNIENNLEKLTAAIHCLEGNTL